MLFYPFFYSIGIHPLIGSVEDITGSGFAHTDKYCIYLYIHACMFFYYFAVSVVESVAIVVIYLIGYAITRGANNQKVVIYRVLYCHFIFFYITYATLIN